MLPPYQHRSVQFTLYRTEPTLALLNVTDKTCNGVVSTTLQAGRYFPNKCF